MSVQNRVSPRNKLGASTTGFIIVVVILLVLAAGGFGLYFTRSPSTSTLTTVVSSATTVTTTTTYTNTSQVATNEITALSYSHWASIGTKNVSAVMAQYAPNAILAWYVSPNSALNGTYTNSTSIKSTWTKFFNANPTTYYTIYNYTLSVNASSATARADIWYVLGNGTVTLKLPYELNYQYQSGKWLLTGDWWGLPSNPGTIVHGIAAVDSTVTSTSTTSTTSQTT